MENSLTYSSQLWKVSLKRSYFFISLLSLNFWCLETVSQKKKAPTKRFFGFNSQSVLGPVIPKTLEMGVFPACMVLMMKWGPRNITGRPSVSIL